MGCGSQSVKNFFEGMSSVGPGLEGEINKEVTKDGMNDKRDLDV